MGTSEHIDGNMDQFYKNIVSTGCYQCVQAVGVDGVEPGSDVKSFMNQRVMPVISADIALQGQGAVRKKMGTARCAMVKVLDPTHPTYIKYGETCSMYRQAMSPLRFSPEKQDQFMLSTLGTPPSTTVNFPDDARLVKEHGQSTRCFFVTHVATDDSLDGRNKVFHALEHHVAQLNNDYVNVRAANPIMTASGEILTLYKIYGVPVDPLLA
jgi:hypothetical protein